MTEIWCPTCERLLVRSHADGSFDLAGQASVTGGVPIPQDVDPASLPIPLRTDVLPLSARCLRCHPHDAPIRRRWWQRALSWFMEPSQ